MNAYSQNMRYRRSELAVAARRVADRLGIELKARSKTELASFLCYYDPTGKLERPQVAGADRPLIEVLTD